MRVTSSYNPNGNPDSSPATSNKTYMNTSASIPEKLTSVRARIDEYEHKYARTNGSTRLIAVSKTQPASSILTASAAGQRDFGENYLQEALDKMQLLADKSLIWHFIGPIQSNKTSLIAEHFDWVHSVDRIKIAQRLNDQCPANKSPLNILLQVNISSEASKSGVSLADLPALAQQVATLKHLRLGGLMAIPAPQADFAQQRLNFSLLANAASKLQEQGFSTCTELSMGMSQDFEAAIAEGSTMVRVGSDIFGPRIVKG